jgi:hypothetical protein
MSASTSISSKPSDVFKTYPEFSKLTYADRKQYEALVRGYPPLSDLSFATLMNWWNALDACAISTLNGNLILSYWVAGMEKMSGISIIGQEQIDETICSIFDQMRDKGEKPRLVHVSEYVIERLQHPELFRFKSERAHDEYILDISKYYPITRAVSYRRHRVKKFLMKTREQEIIVKPVDLGLEENRKLLLHCADVWPRKGTINHIVKYLYDALVVALSKAELIGTEALGLYVDGELQAYMLFSYTSDKRYIAFSHVMVKSEIPYTYDYVVYGFSEWLLGRGIQYVNINSDLGIPALRVLKLALGPANYFHKYTIEPA